MRELSGEKLYLQRWKLSISDGVLQRRLMSDSLGHADFFSTDTAGEKRDVDDAIASGRAVG